MKGTILATGALILATLTCRASLAADLRVPQQHPTIAAALGAAESGDRILIAPGTYYEADLQLKGGVQLVGDADTPSEVVIDAQGAGRVLIANRLRTQAVVGNLTLTGGYASGETHFASSGGAVLCNGSALLLDSCRLVGNHADFNGGALWAFESSPQIFACQFEDNSASAGGGAIDCTLEASPLIRDCRFERNTADWGGAVSCRNFSSPVISSSIFVDNTAAGGVACGGGIFADLDSRPSVALSTFTGNAAGYGGAVANFVASGANLTRCTLVANTATERGAGIYCDDAAPILSANIIAFQEGDGIYSSGTVAPVVSQTNFFGNTGGEWTGAAAPATLGETNLSADPLFCLPEGDDTVGFNVEETSPCAPDSNGGVTLGAWPAGCGTPLPILVEFAAAWQGGHALLTWQVPADVASTAQFRLTGAYGTLPVDEWEIAFEAAPGGTFVAADAVSEELGTEEVTFRLYISYDGQNWSLLSTSELTPAAAVPGLRDIRAWPNPFNPRTTVSFELGRRERVRLSVYDLNGRLVKVLADREFPAGTNDEAWLGDDTRGGRAASGTYVVLVETSARKLASKVTLLK